MKKILYFIPAASYYSLIFYFSSKSYKIRIDMPLFDKWAHLFEFAILAILLFLGYFRSFKSTMRIKALATFITGTLLAISDEIHQYFVPDRQIEILDAAASIGGIILGIIIFWYFSRGIKLKIFSYNFKKEN